MRCASYDARVKHRRRAPFLAALLSVLLAACSHAPAVAEVLLRVDGMTCSACETTIRARVQEEPGIVSCTVDHAAGTAHVTFDPTKVQAPRIADAIRDAGYEVK